jgi:hypothetical protein
MWTRLSGSLVACLGCLLLGGAVRAQSTSAALIGTVRTAEGAPVADAIVQARSETTGALRSAVTDALGAYQLDLLNPGRWTVVARLADGTIGESRSVELSLQQTVQLDFTTGAGLEERVSVVAEAPLVDRQRSGGELRIGGAQVDALPIAGRSVTELALLDASVQAAPAGNFYGERGSVFVVNGQTGRSNSFLVDGLDNNDQTSGTSLNGFFSQQVIREFVVLTHQYAPEFGRAAGGVLNIITHQGSNEHHGDFFFQGTRDGWNESGRLVDSLDMPDDVDDRASRFQTGFRLSGPLRRDKAFWFLAYEHQENDDIAPFIGLNRDGTLGGWTVAPSRSDNIFLRTDFNLSDTHTLMFRLSADDRTSREVNVGGSFTPEFGFRLEEQDIQLAASLTSIISNELINEVRLLVGRSEFDQFANTDRPGVERPSGLFGGNNLNRQTRDEDRVQLVENLTLRRGPHTMKLGFDVVRSKTDLVARFNPSGNFLYRTDDPFNTGDCGNISFNQIDPQEPRAPIPCSGDRNGNGIPDEPGFIYTYPLVYSYIFGDPAAELDDTTVGVFAQDSWQVGSKVVLDYGLRYDVSSYELPRRARVDSTIPNGGASRDRDNVSPRFGFTVTPGSSGRTVVRGGAGIFYNKLVLAFPAVAAITSGTRIGLSFPQGTTIELTENFVEQFVAQNGIDAWRELLESGVLVFPESLTLRFSTDTELDTPYTVQYTLGIEQATGRNSAFSANAIRALGYHLPQMRDLNPVVEIDCGDGTTHPVTQPDPCVGIPVHLDAFGGVPLPERTGSIAALTTRGRSWYSGLDLSWQWRREDRWFEASYTLSESEDTGPDPLLGGIYLPGNPFDIDGEKGPSDFDRRHRLVMSGQVGLPWFGLRLSGVIQLASELPFNVTTGLDENLDGINTDRPAGIDRNSGEDTDLDVINAIRTQEGLPPIDSLRAGDFEQVDVRLSKPFLFGRGRASGELFVQVFNLFNEFNEGPLEGRITSRNFGRPIGYAGPPRTIELGVRLGY